MRYCLIAILFVFMMCTSALCTSSPPIVNPNILVQSKSLGECQSCKLFVESFIKGLERTARGNYEGGDTAWEEEKLKKSYKRSEMRLIDIQESLCKEEEKYAVQCHNIAEKAEDFIELWWTKDLDNVDLFDYICIQSLKFCCPKHHYGKDCLPCLTDRDNLCSGNGKCRGDGTRKGNGTCLCDPGYTEENCDRCSSGYYVSYQDDKKIVCNPCHRSCLGDCRQGSPKDCAACRPGYIFDSDVGCTDINECDDVNKCKKDEFCMNGQGSYACFACDKACDRCHGDGPDSCRKCAIGFTMKGEFCIQDRADDDRNAQLTSTRYMTYAGLLIATVILLPKSTQIGSFVGMMVLSYIFGAEYYCMINGHTGLVDLKDYDLMGYFKT